MSLYAKYTREQRKVMYVVNDLKFRIQKVVKQETKQKLQKRLEEQLVVLSTKKDFERWR